MGRYLHALKPLPPLGPRLLCALGALMVLFSLPASLITSAMGLQVFFIIWGLALLGVVLVHVGFHRWHQYERQQADRRE